MKISPFATLEIIAIGIAIVVVVGIVVGIVVVVVVVIVVVVVVVIVVVVVVVVLVVAVIPWPCFPGFRKNVDPRPSRDCRFVFSFTGAAPLAMNIGMKNHQRALGGQ
ncbi:hypothetical protein [Desulfatirhabdium butyrativorans]|uniref:hypothetical protein n=1 Tax=Desulfatirhabdium butyrativorans TaxID=340467 RepID=UPI000685D88F|nr:hypothetical protein [Desulfatirhabdium butyrativorans]